MTFKKVFTSVPDSHPDPLDRVTDPHPDPLDRRYGSEDQDPYKNVTDCAAKAFYSCPAIISQRLESRIISKEPQENTEEESKII
jgi:hypothetical protein